MRVKIFYILLPVLLFTLYACNDGSSDMGKGLNPVKAVGLDTTTRIEVFDLTGDATVPILRLDEPAVIASLVGSLDATLPVTAKTFCAPRYRLRFTMDDGSTVEIDYFCDDVAPFIRSDADVFKNEDYTVSEDFELLMFNLTIIDHASPGVVSEDKEYTPGSELANPASVFCEEQGGTVEMRTDDAGGQYGMCLFEDGSACEEWAYFRGECKPGD